MAEEGSAEAAGNRSALDIQAGGRTSHMRIKIESNVVAAGFLGAGFMTLRATHRANPKLVETAVKAALATWAAHVLSIRSSSILVDFVCYTEERYQAFMSAFATGTVKQRLQEEFSKIGFKGELEVTIVGDDNAPQKREWMSNPSSPPETKDALPKPGDIRIAALKWEDVDLPIDILLLTAKECEFLSCLHYLTRCFQSFKGGLGNVYFGKIENGDKKLKIAVIQCDKGSGGPQGSGMVVSTGIRELKPKAVICVGYCAGLKKEKVKFGDVIISAKLATYAPIKVTEHGIVEEGYQVPATPRLSEIIKSANFGWKAPLKNPTDLDVKVHKDALLLSGPEVVSNDERGAELLQRFPLAMGAEMEGEGLFAAAHYHNIEWVVIKGVSDFAGDSKSASDHWRPFSSLMAASLVAHILSDVDVYEEWRHYEDK